MTTTDFPTIELPAVASRLDNGCWVLAAKRGFFHDRGIVLGFHSGAGAAQPFATWAVNGQRQTFWGHYFETLHEAIADYTERG